MYIPASSLPFQLRCPRCSQDTRAGDIFSDMDWLHLRPGIATCSECGARFTYCLPGFRTFFAGLATFLVLSLFALSRVDDPPGSDPMLLPLACLVSVLVGAFALPLGGLELVN